MGNALEFVLGLESAEFINGMGESMKAVVEFLGLAELVEQAWEHTWETILEGAQMHALSMATGQSVKGLEQLKHGLEAIGSTADPQMLLMMTQKGLSGVNEQGMRTDILFTRLGLNLQKLRGEGTVTALTDVATALSKLSPNQAAGVAETLFGKFNAGTILQMMRDMKDFQEGWESASNTSSLLDKYAETFQHLKNLSDDIEEDFKGIWIAIAGNLSPELTKVFTNVNNFLKNLGPELDGALAGGHVMEILSDALNAAFEQASFYGMEAFSAVATSFGDALAGVAEVFFTDLLPHLLRKAMDIFKGTTDVAAEGIANDRSGFYANAYMAATAKTPAEKQKFLEMMKQQSGAFVGTMVNTGSIMDSARSGHVSPEMLKSWTASSRGYANGVGALAKDASGANADNDQDFRQKFQDAAQTARETFQSIAADVQKSFGGNAPHAALDKLKSDLTAYKNFSLRADNPRGTDAGAAADSDLNLGASNHFHPEFTALEKMGFVMGGGKMHNPYDQRKVDLLQKIAKNTQHLNRGHGTIDPGAGGGNVIPQMISMQTHFL